MTALTAREPTGVLRARAWPPDPATDAPAFRVRAPASPAPPILGEVRRGPSRPPPTIRSDRHVCLLRARSPSDLAVRRKRGRAGTPAVPDERAPSAVLLSRAQRHLPP